MFYSSLSANTETLWTQRQPPESTSTIEHFTIFDLGKPESQQPLGANVTDTPESPPFGLTELCTNTPPSYSEPAGQFSRSGSSSRYSSSTQTDDDKIDIAPYGKVLLPQIQASFVCSYCDKTFPSQLQHRRCNQQHNDSSSSQINVCRHCHGRFTLPKDLERHYATNACKRVPKTTIIALFACVCGNKYKRKDSLQRHLRSPGSRTRGKTHRPLELP